MPPSRTTAAVNKKNKTPNCDPSPPPSADRSFCLRRGKACHTCRKKKLRCDGVRPTCGYCERRDRDCEFDDPETWGKQRRLQYQVEDLTVKLEAARRDTNNIIQALENQKALNQKLKCQIHPMLLIHNEPVLGLTFNDDIPQPTDPLPTQSRAQPVQQDFNIEFDSPSYYTNTDLSSPLFTLDAMTCPDVLPLHSQEHPSIDLPTISQFDTSAFFDLKLTTKSQSTLLNAFLPHLSQCCLDIPQGKLLSRFEHGGSQALHDSLLYAIFTISCRFATEHTQVSRHENRFRQRTQFALRATKILSRKEVFDSVRAAVLLAMYFTMEDCPKEASTYISMAYGYFLELNRVEDPIDVCKVARVCAPEERSVFQSAYIADRLIAVQLQCPTVFPEQIVKICNMDHRLDAPRPGPSGSIASQPTTPSLSPGIKRPTLDELQLRTQCASLMWNASQSIKWERLNSLLTEAKELRRDLPSIYTKPSSSSVQIESNVDVSILSMHTQVFATLTKLTRRYSPRDEQCLAMAGEVIALIHELRDEDFVFLDPIVGSCWEWCAEAILGEMSTFSHRLDQQNIWTTRIRFIITAMEKLTVHFPIVSVNIANVILQCHVWKVPV